MEKHKVRYNRLETTDYFDLCFIVEGERDCEATGTCELVPGKILNITFNLCMHQTF